MCLFDFKVSLSLRAEMSSLKDRIKSFVNKRVRKNNDSSKSEQPSTTSPTAAAPASTTPPAKQDKPYFQPATLPTAPAQGTADQSASSQGPPDGVKSRVAATQVQAATTTGTLQIQLENQSSSNQVYAYISQYISTT